MIVDLNRYPAMKESGLPGLGIVPQHWEVRRLRTIAEMRVSNVDKHSNDDEEPIRLCNYVDVYRNDRIQNRMAFMSATATRDEINRFKLQPGDVLITKDSETWNDIGVPAFVEDAGPDLICGYHLALLRPISGTIIGEYLFRTLQSGSIAYQFHIEANGVTRYGLSHSAIKSIRLPIPPISEQSVIVRFIDYVDLRIRRYIHAKQKLVKLLEEQKHAVINRIVTRGIDPKVPLKASGLDWLGDVPAHWQVVRSKRIFMPRTELARPNDVQLSATQAYGVIPQDEYERRVGRKIVKISRHLELRRHVEIDDFVISMRSFQGGLERAWAAGCIRSSYVVLRPATTIDVSFFSYLFKSPAYIKALQATANFIRDGQDLNFDNFCAVDLPFPPVEEQSRIADSLKTAIGDIVGMMERTRTEIELLKQYRSRLITDVVTGKVDVRGAEARLPHETQKFEPIDEIDFTDREEATEWLGAEVEEIQEVEA